MRNSFELIGNLIISTDSPFVNIKFDDKQIYVDIISSEIKKSIFPLSSLRLRNLAVKISKWLNDNNLTAILSYKGEVLALSGKNAKASPILKVVSGNNIEIKNLKMIMKLFKGDTNEI